MRAKNFLLHCQFSPNDSVFPRIPSTNKGRIQTVCIVISFIAVYKTSKKSKIIIYLSCTGSIWVVKLRWIKFCYIIYGHWPTYGFSGTLFMLRDRKNRYQYKRGQRTPLKMIIATLSFLFFLNNLTVVLGFLTLYDKHNIRTLSENIKLICVFCETGQKSSLNSCFSICFR